MREHEKEHYEFFDKEIQKEILNLQNYYRYGT